MQGDVLNRALHFHQGCLKPEAVLNSCICDLNLLTIENVLSRGVSALFLSYWSSTSKSIAADTSTSLNLKKTLERSAFQVAKELFFFSCLEVFAPIRMDVVTIR